MAPMNWTRSVLRRAADGTEPDISRLLADVPSMLDEARRRRARAAATDPIGALVPMAWRAIPRMAAAALLLVALAAAMSLSGSPASREREANLDSLIFSEDDLGSTDPILQAIIGGENGNG